VTLRAPQAYPGSAHAISNLPLRRCLGIRCRFWLPLRKLCRMTFCYYQGHDICRTPLTPKHDLIASSPVAMCLDTGIWVPKVLEIPCKHHVSTSWLPHWYLGLLRSNQSPTLHLRKLHPNRCWKKELTLRGGKGSCKQGIQDTTHATSSFWILPVSRPFNARCPIIACWT